MHVYVCVAFMHTRASYRSHTHTHTKPHNNYPIALMLQKIFTNIIRNACTLLRHILESSVWIEDKVAKLQIIIMFAEVGR